MSEEELFIRQGLARKQLAQLRAELHAYTTDLLMQNQEISEISQIIGAFMKDPSTRNPHASAPWAEVIGAQLRRIDLEKTATLIAKIHRTNEQVKELEAQLKG